MILPALKFLKTVQGFGVKKTLKCVSFLQGGRKHTKPTKPKKTVILSWPLGVASDLRDWLVKAYTVWSFH